MCVMEENQNILVWNIQESNSAMTVKPMTDETNLILSIDTNQTLFVKTTQSGAIQSWLDKSL